MKLRKGKTKSILESSIDSALLAVEIYNKPRTTFRTEAYIALMIIAWTRLFHAFFYHETGDKFYYKTKSGRYKLLDDKKDGERKAWDLKTCYKEFNTLSSPIKANLEFFIGLRNKIEHKHIEKHEIESIFGELQSLLYNYENTLMGLFGEKFALNENLVYSLQFSILRKKEQEISNKKILTRGMKDMEEIREYIKKYRNSLDDSVFNSQEYSIKLIQIPKISNTNRNDAAIEFVQWDKLSDEDKEKYQQQINAIIKEKVVKKEAVNVGKLKPSEVLASVKKQCGIELNHYHHKCFYFVFSIRPIEIKTENIDPSKTNTKYCQYDELHGDYVFQKCWVDFLVKILSKKSVTKESIKSDFNAGRKKDISEYE